MVVSRRLSGTDLPDLCRLAWSGVQVIDLAEARGEDSAERCWPDTVGYWHGHPWQAWWSRSARIRGSAGSGPHPPCRRVVASAGPLTGQRAAAIPGSATSA